MKLWLCAVGRLRPAYREAADDYLRRLRRVADVVEVEVREAGRSPSAELALRVEGERLAQRIPADARLVALDRQGAPWSSEAVAEQLQAWQLHARPVTLLLGGSHGLQPELRQRAHQVWSLGPLTLPHELARVVVLEQLYRAGTILRGEPYHK